MLLLYLAASANAEFFPEVSLMSVGADEGQIQTFAEHANVWLQL